MTTIGCSHGFGTSATLGGPRALPPGIGIVAAHLERLYLLVGRNHPLAAHATVTRGASREMTTRLSGHVSGHD